MPTLTILKEYLVGEDGYLFNDENNGKTIMLSGTWGSGKTHFWKNEIENILSEKLKDNHKAYVYVSLYGKDSIEAIKNEILFKAYENIKEENKLASRAISAFGFTSRLLSVSVHGVRANTASVGDAVENFFESKKINDAESFLADGGLICLDDFERKSKNIDLNDLFGFITQLNIDMNCKIIIILNSDVFEGKEANIFKTVKEKTISKFLYYQPSIKELFETIYKSNKKYQKLDVYKEDILKAINETKELNARIYIQVLDNCLEWLKYNEYNTYEVRALILITVNFLKHHFTFEYRVLEQRNKAKLYSILDKFYQDNALLELAEYFIQIVPQISPKINQEDFEEYINSNRNTLPIKSSHEHSEFLHSMYSIISKKEEKDTKNESYYQRLDKVFNENKNIFLALYYFAYLLNVEYKVEKNKFDKINQFVKTGILIASEEDSIEADS